MELNDDALRQARAMARDADAGSLTLPAAILGFPELCLASAHDKSVAAISGFISEKGTSYKIGMCSK
jgi:hypothetical protein